MRALNEQLFGLELNQEPRQLLWLRIRKIRLLQQCPRRPFQAPSSAAAAFAAFLARLSLSLFALFDNSASTASW